MNPNPTLRRLGLDGHDRVAIIHTDDIGMCQATVDAFADLVDFGLISCGATMVPCAWFPLLAAYCRRHPQVDMGVHLDLTCEWDGYRWGPVSTRDLASGLIDDEGYFWRSSRAVWEHGDATAVQAELEAQIERALAAGIDVSHIDTHMGAVAHVKYVAGYLDLARQYRVPAMVARLDAAGWRARGLDAAGAAFAERTVQQLADSGWPLLDALVGLPLDQPEGRIDLAKRALGALPQGITHFIIHPAKDTPELRAIAPDWRSRVADYQAFTSPELRDYVRNSGIQVIGYRELRAVMRVTDGA